MKGPSERVKYDLRRLWECPVCKRRERTAGTVTFRHCSCQIKQLDGRQIPMKLVADGVQRLTPPIQIKVSSEAVEISDEPVQISREPATAFETSPSGETVAAEPAASQPAEPASDGPEPPAAAF